MDAITRYLGVGSYAQWDEQTRQSWLVAELQGKRPLLPRGDSLDSLGFDETVQVCSRWLRPGGGSGPGARAGPGEARRARVDVVDARTLGSF